MREGDEYVPSEDGQEGTLRLLEDLGKVLELLVDEKTSGAGEIDAHHRAVGAVAGAEGVIDEDVAELAEGVPELLDLGRVGLDLLALLVHARALFLNVEAQVLQKNLPRLEKTKREGTG